MQRTPRPRFCPRRGNPLPLLLLPVVVAIGGALVAMLLLPAAAGISAGVTRVDQRLATLGDAFTRIPKFPERSTIYASDGKTVLATVYLDENRELVHLSGVSDIAQKAVLAIEDDGFYQHGALNLPSVVRALLANLSAGQVVQGGSTISQQLVKNAVIGDTAQTFQRKFQELALAMRVEQRYSKDQILELYLNDVYLGNGIYGIGTAALYYYGIPASKLNLNQSATLAGMIQAPESYNPIDHPKAAVARRNVVLDRMATLGWVDQTKIDKTKAAHITLPKNAGKVSKRPNPFFVTYIVHQVLSNPNHQFDAFGKTVNQRTRTLFQGGLSITTTLDPSWQRFAQEAAQQPYAIPASNPGYKQKPDTAIVSVDNASGAIRTMLSGRNYYKDQLDLATATRQPGSSFKPFTLVAAFEKGVPPGQVYDSKTPFCSPKWPSPDHCVNNAEPGTGGFIDLWAATAESVNVVFAQLALQIGPQAIVDAAHTMGIRSPLPVVPSITLGTGDVSPLEMASAYSTLANNGVHCQPFAVAKVTDSGGVLYRHKPQCKQVIPADIAHLVTAMLQGVIDHGTGTNACCIGHPIAGKTGTTQEYSNAWFVGYTRQVSTAVWVGFPGAADSLSNYFGQSVFGGTLAAPIWHNYMLKVMAGMPAQGFPSPPTPQTGKVPNVVGKTSSQAQKVLAAANFSSDVKMVPSLDPAGTVVAQTPRGGTSTELGTLVHLEVSNGHAPQSVVPDVRGLTADKAKTALEAAGFKVAEVDKPVADPTKIGHVFAQDPGPGTKADQGSTVTISVWVQKQ
jgi:penicillin-binding protein 1A